jgi:glucosyl-3-phosphoglycerate phosphatase
VSRHPHRRLVLVRHGRTAWNVDQRAQGHTDVPLDEVGAAQARAAAPVLAGLAPVTVWSSDLTRAATTARPVAEALSLPLHRDSRLREFDLGERTGMTMPEYAEAFPDEYAAFRAGRYDVVPGGESTPQVVHRVTASLEECLAGLAAGECAVVVSHGAALKVSVLALLGWPAATASGLQALDNCHWAVLEDSGPDGRLRLTAYNVGPTTPDFASSPPTR